MHDASTDDRNASHGNRLRSTASPGHVGRQRINGNPRSLSMLKRTICA